jgi:hypothetical protein
MDDVQATLDKFSVPAAEEAKVKALVESTRTAIVVSGTERKKLAARMKGVILNWSSLLGGAIVGAATWFFADFFVRPIRRFWQMRAESVERINFFGNLLTHERGAGLGADAERTAEAMNTLRELGTRMLSFATTETLVVRLLRSLGFDPERAGRHLIAYSNTIMIKGAERAVHREEILEALRIKE